MMLLDFHLASGDTMRLQVSAFCWLWSGLLLIPLCHGPVFLNLAAILPRWSHEQSLRFVARPFSHTMLECLLLIIVSIMEDAHSHYERLTLVQFQRHAETGRRKK